MNPFVRKDLHALLSAVVDDTLTEAQAAELSRLLATDAAARRFYVRYLDMNAALADVPQRPSVVRPQTLSWSTIATAAAAVSVLAAAILLIWRAPATGLDRSGVEPGLVERSAVGGSPAVAGYVATIVSASDDCVLNGEGIFAGERLLVGTYEVADGQLTVQFDGGATVFFEGKPSFTLRSRRVMEVHRGTFVFDADKFCESIEIMTPHSTYKNIGTRYAAVISEQGEEVHVAKGAVRRTAEGVARRGEKDVIKAGGGVRYSTVNGETDSIPLDVVLVSRSLAKKADSARATVPQRTVVADFVGDGDQLEGHASGKGWSEAWRSDVGFRRIVPGLAGVGSVAVRHDASSEGQTRRISAAHRRLETPIDLAEDGVWYLRFLVRRGPRVGRDAHSAMLVLRKYGLTPKQEIEQGSLIQIALRKDDSAMVRIGDAITRASLPQNTEETYAVIVKIVSGRAKPEQVLVRVMGSYRLAHAEEPEDWSVVSESVASNMLLDQVSLECASSSWIDFGELCIGPTWESVTRLASQ
jgi:anti-sigma factor RsiW